MKSNLAYKLYENQLRIEEEQRAPFQKRPLIEPQISPEVRARFLYSNPYYSDDTTMTDLDKAQKIRLLKSVNINLPPGVDPDGIIADDYIRAHIQKLSNATEQPLRTVSDLVAFYESPDEKQQEQLQNISREIKALPDDLISKYNAHRAELDSLEKDLWGDSIIIDEGAGEFKVESKIRPKRDDEVIPEAVTPVYYTRTQLQGMTVDNLRKYGRETLKLKNRKGFSLSGNRNQIIDTLMKRTAEFTHIKNVA